MNTEIIHATALATLAGNISFADVVGQLLAAGVASYHVDYVRMQKAFYGASGDVVVSPITYEDMPPVAPEFSVEVLRANIVDSQRHGQKYREFTRRAMAGGVQGYITFLRGKRVTYWGRTGDSHTEWFPGAGPGAKV